MAKVNQVERASRAWPKLISVAKSRSNITYGELASALGIHHRPVRYVLGVLQDYCLAEGLPPLLRSRHRNRPVAAVGSRYSEPEQIIEWRGTLRVLRCDKGPERISGTLMNWARERGIRVEYIQPGKLQQNAYVERYNRTVRYDWLSQYPFDSIEQV